MIGLTPIYAIKRSLTALCQEDSEFHPHVIQWVFFTTYRYFFIKTKFNKIPRNALLFETENWCPVVMSMFVSSKWQRVVLPTRWRASVRTLFYCYLPFLDHRTNISRKVRVSASGAPNKFQNCHLDKTNMDKTSQYRRILIIVLGIHVLLLSKAYLFDSQGGCNQIFTPANFLIWFLHHSVCLEIGFFNRSIIHFSWKGQCHEIFECWFFASNWSSWSPYRYLLWDDFDFFRKFTEIFE